MLEKNNQSTKLKEEYMLFKDKVVMVTGSSGGIGKATAIAFAKEGADIYLHYNNSESECIKVAKEIKGSGGNCYLVKADLTSMNDIKKMFTYVRQTTNWLDILVNNAGILKKSYIKSMSEELWEEVMNTNLKSAFFCAKYAFPLLIKAGGNIVNVASLSSLRPIIGESCYGAAKAGLVSLTRSMALEYGRFNVNVNAVSPGPVNTSMREIRSVELEKLIKKIPLGRISKVDDIANAILFLCSEQSSCITGQILNVDGGLSI